MALLDEHVARFNEGVRTGDWSRMLALLTDDATLEFDGIPVGPYRGRDAIEAAYRAQPPDDEILLLDGGPAYAWARVPAQRAGELHLGDATAASPRFASSTSARAVAATRAPRGALTAPAGSHR